MKVRLVDLGFDSEIYFRYRVQIKRLFWWKTVYKTDSKCFAIEIFNKATGPKTLEEKEV